MRLRKNFFSDSLDIDNKIVQKKVMIKAAKTIKIVLVLLVFSTLLYFSWKLLFQNKDQAKLKLMYINLDSDARIVYPYENLKHFLKTSKKCNLGDKLFFDSLEKTEFVTISHKPEIWLMLNMTHLFEFMNKLLDNQKYYGMYTICSTMLGLPNLPCACVTRLINNQTIYFADISLEPFEIGNYLRQDLAVVSEKNYYFKTMVDSRTKKIVPKTIELESIQCKKITEKKGLECEKKKENFEGKDIFLLARTSYYLNFNPETYTLNHPHFGDIE